jgi:hypothetical protein
MVKRVVFLSALAALVAFPVDVFAEETEVLSFDTKEMEADSDGDVWFGIKIKVRNSGQPGSIVVVVKALDKEGFELKSVLLRREFGANEINVLLERTCLDKRQYPELDKWIIYGISNWPD